jgi:hypothetical protein
MKNAGRTSETKRKQHFIFRGALFASKLPTSIAISKFFTRRKNSLRCVPFLVAAQTRVALVPAGSRSGVREPSDSVAFSKTYTSAPALAGAQRRWVNRPPFQPASGLRWSMASRRSGRNSFNRQREFIVGSSRQRSKVVRDSARGIPMRAAPIFMTLVSANPANRTWRKIGDEASALWGKSESSRFQKPKLLMPGLISLKLPWFCAARVFMNSWPLSAR